MYFVLHVSYNDHACTSLGMSPAMTMSLGMSPTMTISLGINETTMTSLHVYLSDSLSHPGVLPVFLLNVFVIVLLHKPLFKLGFIPLSLLVPPGHDAE